MTSPWWGKDAIDRRPRGERVEPTGDEVAPAVRRPVVFARDAGAIAAEIRGRRGAFTPTWTGLDPDDPGLVAIDLVAAQVALVAQAIGDLPTKARVDLLRTAGVTALGPTPMSTMVAFTISPTAPEAVTIGTGFAATGVDVDGNPVRFETDRTLMAAPMTIAAAATEQDGITDSVTLPSVDEGVPVAPFGRQPASGNAFYLGLDGPIAPGPRLSVGWFVPATSSAPPAVAMGGVIAAPGRPAPILGWHTFDGVEWQRADVVRDDTDGFRRTGVIELQLARRWRPAVVVAGKPALRWLRVTLVRGGVDEPAALAGIVLNAVPATAGETRRDEVLTPIEEPGRRPRRFALARDAVVPRSLALVVDEGAAEPVPWRQVDDLASSDGDDRVYVLDAGAGIVTFGDGVRGRPAPHGFRHVQAISYRTIAPSQRVAAGALATPVGSASFVVGVTNPRAPSGQRLSEDLTAVLRRGPRELRARGRAVNPADYQVCALRAGGIRRAYAIGGHHPLLPGRPIPGVVGVLVVGEQRDDGGPPIPDEATLRAVARYLSEEVAPAGVEVVAAAPRFHRIAVEADVELRHGVDVGAAIAAVLEELDEYLDPLRGGDDGEGWPFGEPLRHTDLLRRLLERSTIDGVPVLRAVPRLNLVLDGVRSLGCRDLELAPHALVWPGGHEVFLREDTP